MLYYSGAAQVLFPMFGGLGAIFMLHHVRPGRLDGDGFAPNAGLEISPRFLDAVLDLVAERGYELLSLAEAARRLRAGKAAQRPFAVFTLDDGYRDNLVHALPVFRKHQCPFTIFVAPAIADGRCELWWRGLEAVIAGSAHVRTVIGGEEFDLTCVSDAQKQAAWERLYWPVRTMEQEHQRRWIREFCSQHGVDLDVLCRAEALTWDELRLIAADPLCTIGAHTINHFAVAKLEESAALAEMTGSAARIGDEIGRKPDVFAYPYGDAGSAGPRDFRLAEKAGFAAAVTTRKGLIFPAHAQHLTALPRFSLAGAFQKLRYVDVMLSGTPFALLNGLKRVKVA